MANFADTYLSSYVGNDVKNGKDGPEDEDEGGERGEGLLQKPFWRGKSDSAEKEEEEENENREKIHGQEIRSGGEGERKTSWLGSSRALKSIFSAQRDYSKDRFLV